MIVIPSAPHHPDILESLSHFADHITHCGFDRCYVFGSLINCNGRFFTRSGSEVESDVDILITFSLPAATTFETRYSSCCALLPLVAQLEKLLHSLLGRGDPGKKICSILPVTEYELYHNINEGQDINFYQTTQFCLVPHFTSPLISLGHGHDERYHMVYNELLLALKYAQTTRKEFLAVAPDETRSLTAFTGGDILPKMLMRRAALISAWQKNDTQHPNRTELINGFKFLHEKLGIVHPLLSEIRDVLDHRTVGRGNVPPVTENHRLLLGEFLFDLARDSIPITLREQFDKVIQRYHKSP